MEHQRIVSGQAEGFVVWFASCSGGHCWFIGIAAGGHHSNLPLAFCRWGSFVPILIFLPLEFPGFWVLNLWGFWISGCSCVTILVIGIIIRRISQSFLISNKFPDILPALGHRVPVQIGASSNSGGLFCEV